jgi:hypothetical protein
MSSSFSANFESREDLEALDQVRFEAVGLPDSQHRGVADAGLPGERARAPVCRSFGRGLRRQAHDLSSIDARLAPTARQVIFYRRDAALKVACAPIECNSELAIDP